MGDEAPDYFSGQPMSRSRRSHRCAAASFANFGIDARVDPNRPTFSTQCPLWLQRRPDAARRTM
ncbi:MAG: hypothetical protein ACXU85_24520, partial [Xanthobacteraceae bacterium]